MVAEGGRSYRPIAHTIDIDVHRQSSDVEEEQVERGATLERKRSLQVRTATELPQDRFPPRHDRALRAGMLEACWRWGRERRAPPRRNSIGFQDDQDFLAHHL